MSDAKQSPIDWTKLIQWGVLLSALGLSVSAQAGGCRLPPPGPPPAPPADIALPAGVTTPVGLPVVVTATTKGDVVKWIPGAGLWLVFSSTDTHAVGAGSATEGVYPLWAYTLVNGVPSDPAQTFVTVGKGPGPIPPKPPGPTPPTPVPPTPQPIKVLIVDDFSKRSTLTKEQLTALTAESVRSALDANCEGGRNGWRHFDVSQDMTKEDAFWQNVFKNPKTPRASLPWIQIGSTSAGTLYEGPYPKTDADALALLKKYGGK